MSYALMKSDGSYEEIDNNKVERLVSNGFIVKSWREMFEDTLEVSTSKIKDLESLISHRESENVKLEEKLRIAVEVLDSEDAENITMQWLHKNYLDSYDKFTSSYHRIIARDLLKELTEKIRAK